MQYQKKPGWCGPAALRQALTVFGIRVGQHKLAKLLGGCEDGADEKDLLRAVDTLAGVTAEEFRGSRKRDTLLWLTHTRNPKIICVDNWGHWVCVAGGCGPRLWLFDSTTEPWNRQEGGVHALLPMTILRRWRAAKKTREGELPFYGIQLRKVTAPTPS